MNDAFLLDDDLRPSGSEPDPAGEGRRDGQPTQGSGRDGETTTAPTPHTKGRTPMKRTINSLLVAVAAALALGATVGGAAPKPGFRAGTWVGSGVQKGIFAVVPGDPTLVDGTASFTLTVGKSNRASGTLTLKTQMELDYLGMRGHITGVAKTALTGSGSDIRFAGPMRLEGELTDGKLKVPFGITKPISGRLLISRAFCTSVTGGTDSQLSFKWRAVPKPGTPRPKCN